METEVSNKSSVFKTHVGKSEMSQWWPFHLKGGWAGRPFPIRGGFTPPSSPPPAWVKNHADSKAISIPGENKLKSASVKPCDPCLQFVGRFCFSLVFEFCVNICMVILRYTLHIYF